MLRVENLFLKKGNFLLHKLSFEVPSKSYFVLLGKTGSGKTLLLETIAGLHPGAEGEILFDDSKLSDQPPEARNIGFVYQDFVLFPHLSVLENITFASRYRQIPDRKRLLEDLIDFLELKELLSRRIVHLSGGEKQRVALARAIYSRPKLLLLDEPLSAVDPTFRNEIMKVLREIPTRYDTTVLHVTHNFREASYLAERIAVILDGKILQIGLSREVLEKPTSLEVARFLGFKNIFPTSLLGFDQRARYFSVDPNRIRFSSEPEQGDYCFPCEIEEVMGITDHYKVFARVKDALFFAKVPRELYEKNTVFEKGRGYLCFSQSEVGFL